MPDYLQPLALEAIDLIIGAFVLYMANLIRVRVGIDVSKTHQENIHKALLSGAEAWMHKDATTAREVLVGEIVEYAEQSVPDAIRKIKPPNKVLRRLAEAKLNEVLKKKE